MPVFSLCRELCSLAADSAKIPPLCRVPSTSRLPGSSSPIEHTQPLFGALLRGSCSFSEQPSQGGFPRNSGESTANKNMVGFLRLCVYLLLKTIILAFLLFGDLAHLQY